MIKNTFLLFTFLITLAVLSQDLKLNIIELQKDNNLASCVAFSPEGRLAVGNMDGNILFWNVKTQSVDNTLKDHSNIIIHMAYSPDGKLLATGGKDKSVLVWEVGKGTVLHRFEEHKGAVTSLSFSRDSKYLATASADEAIHVWDLNTKTRLHTFSAHEKEVSSLHFSHDGTILASGSYDGTIKIWDVATGKLERNFNPDAGKVRSVAFSPDDRLVACGFDDKTIRIWDVTAGASKLKLEGHKKEVYDLEFSPDGKYIGSIGFDNTLKIWSLEQEKAIFEYNKFYKLVSLSFSLDGKYIATGELDKKVKIFDLSPLNINPDNKLNVLRNGNKYNSGIISEAPSITLIQPLVSTAGEVITRNEAAIGIKGKVKSNAGLFILMVNGIETQPDREGNFSQPIKLGYLDNVIQVKAIDRDKQISEFNFTINRPLDANSVLSGSSRRGIDFALLIATNDYQEMTDLTNPINDAKTIESELKNMYGFETELIINPKLNDIYAAIRRYSIKQFGKEDQFFIFIAGHGEFDEIFKEGYLVASDSKKKDEVKSTYISHSNLRTIVNNIPCEHTFLTMDVCFGGTFDPNVAHRGIEANALDVDEFILRKLKYKTRLYLTSGGKEYVPDGRPGQHSPFTRKFLEALRTQGGEDHVLTINEIKSFVEKVHPEPRFGEFGDNAPGSDFMFIRK